MNLDKLISLSVAAVLALSVTMNLDQLQTWIWRAQAKLIYESRTKTWGSPRFFPRPTDNRKNKMKEAKNKSKPS